MKTNNNFSKEEVLQIVQNRLQNIGNYENIMIPQKHHPIKQDQNIQKSILIHKEREKISDQGHFLLKTIEI